jgi:hypothetical protein
VETRVNTARSRQRNHSFRFADAEIAQGHTARRTRHVETDRHEPQSPLKRVLDGRYALHSVDRNDPTPPDEET